MADVDRARVTALWQRFAQHRSAGAPGAPLPVADLRRAWEAVCDEIPLAGDATIEPLQAGDVPALWIAAPGASARATIVLLHGGGYTIGSARSERAMAAELSRASGARVLALDYRLAPEHPYPAALEDALSAYGWLLAQGRRGADVVLLGSSAGGGLALGALLALRDAGEELPAAGVAISPFADFTFAGEAQRLGIDPESVRPLEAAIASYRGDADPRTPSLSPVYGDFSGLPPLLLLAGSTEVLVHDCARRLAERAAAAGVPARLEVGEGEGHVWPMFCTILPEGQQAVDDIGRFVRARVGSPAA